MPSQIGFTTIFPDPFKIDSFKRALEDGFELIEDELLTTFELTWNADIFDSSHNVNMKKEAIAKAETNNLIYFFISGGTRVRYATMSQDWQSATKPGRLLFGSSTGRVVRISKAHPRPGIQARNFPELVKVAKEGKIIKIMQESLDEGAKNSNHAIKA